MVKHIFYFARHGESMGNIKRSFIRPIEDTLTDNGRIQAGLLGDHLSEIKFTRVYSSDYSRTDETAQTVLGKSKTSPPSINHDERLREMRVGQQFAGLNYTEAIKKVLLLKGDKSLDEWEVPEGETSNDMYSRFGSFLNDVLNEVDKSTEPETVLIVSHAFFLRRIMLYLNNNFETVGWDGICAKIMRNATYIKVQFGDRVTEGEGKRKIEFLVTRGSSHLPKLEKADSLVEFAKSPQGEAFQACVQT